MHAPAIKIAAALILAQASLAGCTVIPDAPNVVGTPVAEGTAVPLGQPVAVGDLAVTPMRVVEDSRCPAEVDCVWAGRLVVETRIDGAGWRDTASISVGQSYGTHGKLIALVAAEPARSNQTPIEPAAYRFAYAAR